jgi:hypothetical protein
MGCRCISRWRRAAGGTANKQENWLYCTQTRKLIILQTTKGTDYTASKQGNWLYCKKTRELIIMQENKGSDYTASEEGNWVLQSNRGTDYTATKQGNWWNCKQARELTDRHWLDRLLTNDVFGFRQFMHMKFGYRYSNHERSTVHSAVYKPCSWHIVG